MNFGSPQAYRKPEEFSISTYSGVVVTIGRLQFLPSAWAFEALPYSRFVSDYRSYFQMLAHKFIVEMRLGSGESQSW